MHNKEVFYIHFVFHLPYLHNMQAMYISCNIEVHLCNHCCNIGAINITYPENVFETSVIHQAMHILHTVICDLSSSIIFFSIISSMAGFLEDRDRERKKCVF